MLPCLTFARSGNTAILITDNNEHLSKRELEVLQLIADGLTGDQIADKLTITKDTVNAHRKNIKIKLGGGNTAHIVAKGFRMGYIR